MASPTVWPAASDFRADLTSLRAEPRVVEAVAKVVHELDRFDVESYSDAVRAVLATHTPAPLQQIDYAGRCWRKGSPSGSRSA